jgi:hypothetical protein
MFALQILIVDATVCVAAGTVYKVVNVLTVGFD